MIGPNYWATGITVTFHEPYGSNSSAWSGRIDFMDDGFADDSITEGRIATEGRLHTRYAVEAEPHTDALMAVIDVLLRDAARLGIEWRMKHIYYPGDGESADYAPPSDWRQLLAAQAARIGWSDTYYVTEAIA